MPNALLLSYGLELPSFRHRMRSLVESLQASGWSVRCEQFPSGRYGIRTWERRKLLRWADVTVLHQIKLSDLEARLFTAFARHSIFDVDDAIYVRKPRRLGDAPDGSIWRRRKFAATCRGVDLVAAGNGVLAGVARPHARAIAIMPTSIDPDAYRVTTAGPRDPPTVAWIGSPENLSYLEMIRPALGQVAVRYPTFKLRVICSKFPQWDDVPIEPVQWSSATEAEALAGAHIGIMPLTDDEWARGKCAFKLLQYMAAALPCVASPVGANTEAVLNGITGLHASDAPQWRDALIRLIESPQLRARMGAAGRTHVATHFALQTYRMRYADLLAQVAAGNSPRLQ